MGNNAKNIKEILANDNYVIPRYQRNYAWGKAEISQLIKDIDDFFSNENDDKSYYLGSLVCFKREDGSFELIDGQQRHTTITLINLVLKNWENKNTLPVSNLKFDSRKKIQKYIESLYEVEKSNFQKQVEELNTLGTGNFKDAIEIIQEELREKDVEDFARNFYNNVYLFRMEVPEDTDLNHYFEIMNNRGEQLEKHEIVKALLMSKIEDDDEQKKLYAQKMFVLIWDACADMGNYVWFNFDMEVRKFFFPSESEFEAQDFNEIISIYESNDKNKNSPNENNNDNKDSLDWIICEHEIPIDFPKEEEFIKDKYKSVIDFPNFLLQILKIKNDEVSLDDKKLLEQFESITPTSENFSKEFIYNLLKYRVLFDKFIIKRDLADADESKQNWGIRELNTDRNTDTYLETTIRTFGNDEELTKLQVMLYYSDSTNTYNNWVQEILKNTDFSVDKYTKKIWTIAKDKFKKDKLSYPEISIFDFYFIDFLLWKLYAENIKGKETYVGDNFDKLNNLKNKISKQKELFNLFKFRQISSREHLFSRAHAKRYEIDEEVYNGIGNLCLISPSQNSAGNKENPSDKKKMFQHGNSSLKRLVMFESYENKEWGARQISKHQAEIEALIKYYTK